MSKSSTPLEKQCEETNIRGTYIAYNETTKKVIPTKSEVTLTMTGIQSFHYPQGNKVMSGQVDLRLHTILGLQYHGQGPFEVDTQELWHHVIFLPH